MFNHLIAASTRLILLMENVGSCADIKYRMSHFSLSQHKLFSCSVYNTKYKTKTIFDYSKLICTVLDVWCLAATTETQLKKYFFSCRRTMSVCWKKRCWKVIMFLFTNSACSWLPLLGVAPPLSPSPLSLEGDSSLSFSIFSLADIFVHWKYMKIFL